MEKYAISWGSPQRSPDDGKPKKTLRIGVPLVAGIPRCPLKVRKKKAVNHLPQLLSQNTLGAYLKALSEKTPTPGGGAAAALTLAQSCALFAMALRVSSNDLKNPLPPSPFLPNPPPELAQVLAQFDGLQSRFLALGDQDVEVFNSLMGAYRLPKETAADRETRRHQIQTQTVLALKVPLQMAETGLVTLRWAPFAVYLSKATIISDCAIALELLVSGIHCCLVNIAINLKSLTDQSTREKTLKDMHQIEQDTQLQSGPLRDYCKKLLD